MLFSCGTCAMERTLRFVSESDSSGLLKFIKTFDPCFAPCSSSETIYSCPTQQYGVCNEHCNNADCAFDGGDCHQLCNLYAIANINESNTTCTL